MMTESPWRPDVLRLNALIAQGWGTLLWEREKDGRWYLASLIQSLFEENILELRWGGAQRPPSRIIRVPVAEQNPEELALGICRRRYQHGYVLQGHSHRSHS